MIYYKRDENNHLIGFRYNYKHYYYLKDAQEDIIGIMDSNYNVIANYKYDAYGNIVSIKDNNGNNITDTNHIAYINSFRYRSYYYDEEKKLYYLNSRYYNPLFGRFINADIGVSNIGNIEGYNMYQYAFNNPITFDDCDGNWPKWIKRVAVGLTVIAVCAVATIATGGVGVAGYIATTALKAAVTTAVVTTAVGATKEVVKNRTTTGSWNGSGQAALDGGSKGFMYGSIAGATGGVVKGANDIRIATASWDKGTFKNSRSSMNYHYDKHVVKSGIKKNIVDYTDDALNFANRNSDVLQFSARRNTLPTQSGFVSPYSPGASGGWFTKDGRILTFWYKK